MTVRMRVLLILLAAAALTPVTRAQSATWTHVNVAGPSPRYGHAMAYDSARGVVVLFGGWTGAANGETWEWNGSAWAQRLVSGPTSRANPAMAYDSARHVTVLFGGSDGSGPFTGYSAETWEWNGTAWTQRAVSGPSARADHAMAYDSARGVTVLFGGYDPTRGPVADTWEWNGTAWSHRLITGPAVRDSTAMVYDPGRAVTMLFGGDLPGGAAGDTWEWNGAGAGAWAQRTVAAPTPPSRYGHAMAFDTARAVTVLCCGQTTGAAALLGDTWEWNATAWAQQASTGPSPRSSPAMAYDSGRAVTVLFGGSASNGALCGDTWVLGSACGSADFNNDGDSGTDADIEAFFACLAGNCCATCGTADFNGDGDTATDADIEAFFRVLAGGNC